MRRAAAIIIVLMAAGLSLAANEVKLAYEVGNNLYFRIFNSTCQVYNTSGAAFQALADGNVTDYDTVLTGTGGSFYTGTFPALADGTYSVVSYQRAGGTPAVADEVISAGFMEWRSSAEVDWASLIDLIDTIIASLPAIEMPRVEAASQP